MIFYGLGGVGLFEVLFDWKWVYFDVDDVN